ncbi:hypothetical protein BH23BAC3_BH23BAC3_03080 [soil metagenome]
MSTDLKHNLPQTADGNSAVYVIHENEEWLIPLREAFKELDVPYEEWFINEGSLSLDDVPPDGVFYNRMSASSHTRSHQYAVELTGPVLAWLENHGRRVVNGRRALQLEIRKFEQYLSLQKHDITTPKTIAATGKDEILKAAHLLDQTPFILKPNRGGKGQGVELFRTIEELEKRLEEKSELSLDGISLVQQYIKPHNDTITRLEFIGGKFFYGVQVDTSEGFELCPADSCAVGEEFCPAPGDDPKHKFTILDDFRDSDLISRLENFFAANDIEVGAAEFVENENGERFVYDININTNYNRQAEINAGDKKKAMLEVARFLGEELENATDDHQEVAQGIPV